MCVQNGTSRWWKVCVEWYSVAESDEMLCVQNGTARGWNVCTEWYHQVTKCCVCRMVPPGDEMLCVQNGTTRWWNVCVEWYSGAESDEIFCVYKMIQLGREGWNVVCTEWYHQVVKCCVCRMVQWIESDEICCVYRMVQLGREWWNVACAEWYRQVMQWGREFRQQGVFRIWLLTKPVVGCTTAETMEVSVASSLCTVKSLCLQLWLWVFKQGVSLSEPFLWNKFKLWLGPRHCSDFLTAELSF